MITDNRTNEQHLKNAILAGVKKGARSDKEAVQNYRDSESTIRAALPDLRLYLALPPDAACGDGCELGSYLDITLEERDEARVSRDAALAELASVKRMYDLACEDIQEYSDVISKVRRYADERSVYAKTKNNTVGSWRIASDLHEILGDNND